MSSHVSSVEYSHIIVKTDTMRHYTIHVIDVRLLLKTHHSNFFLNCAFWNWNILKEQVPVDTQVPDTLVTSLAGSSMIMVITMIMVLSLSVIINSNIFRNTLGINSLCAVGEN